MLEKEVENECKSVMQRFLASSEREFSETKAMMVQDSHSRFVRYLDKRRGAQAAARTARTAPGSCGVQAAKLCMPTLKRKRQRK
jgi:hypothetical protein